MKTGIKLTRNTSLYDLIKVTNVLSQPWAYGLVLKLFHKLQCLEHFNIVDVPEHYNHTLLDSVWYELSRTQLRYYCLELLI